MLIMPKFVEKNRLNMPSTRIRQEQEIVAQMVRIYAVRKKSIRIYARIVKNFCNMLMHDCLIVLSERRKQHAGYALFIATNRIGARKCRRSCVLLAPE